MKRMRCLFESYSRIIRKKKQLSTVQLGIYTILGNLFSCIAMFLILKWPCFAALPSSSLFRIFAMRSSVVKAENFADTTSPTSLSLPSDLYKEFVFFVCLEEVLQQARTASVLLSCFVSRYKPIALLCSCASARVSGTHSSTPPITGVHEDLQT